MDALDEIADANDLGDLHSILRPTFLDHGFESFAGGCVLDPGKLADMFLQHWPADWTREYLSNGYGADDPVIARALSSSTPFTLEDLMQADPSHRVLQAALAFGWTRCLVFPVHEPRGEIGLVCLASRSRRERCVGVADLLRIAKAAYRRGRILTTKRSVALSPRQREALVLAASGLNDDEIADRLNISRHTAHSHIEGAKRCLGARSRAQAVAIASDRRLL